MTMQVIDATGATITIKTPNEIAADIVAAVAALQAAMQVEEYFPATQTVSGTVALDGATLAALESITTNGPLTDTQLRAAVVPVALDAPSLAALETTELGAATLAALETIELGAASLAALESVTATVTGVATAAKQDEATAAINALTGTEYETVAASVTDQVMGATGAIGDLLTGLLIVPATTSPGAVTIKDGSGGSAITVFLGGASSITTLHPIPVPLNIKSAAAGGWRVSTGANVSVIATGNFT